MKVIETHGLTKRYHDKTAVEAIKLSVESGQVYGFLGPNGAGKSTCIKMLMGLVRPTAGTGLVLGRPLGDRRALAKIGYLPELFRFQEWMTGVDLLNFHSRLYGLLPSAKRNSKVLDRVGMSGREQTKVGACSKGMRQRLGLACALLPQPDLVFLDEPTSALDPVGRKEVRDIIVSLKQEGTTVFLNSHLLSEVESVSDSITIIYQGKIVRSGNMQEMLNTRPAVRIVCNELDSNVLTDLKIRFDARVKVQKEDGSFLMTLKSQSQIPDVAVYLVEQGVRLYELMPVYQTLEQVFLKAVGEEGQ